MFQHALELFLKCLIILMRVERVHEADRSRVRARGRVVDRPAARLSLVHFHWAAFYLRLFLWLFRFLRLGHLVGDFTRPLWPGYGSLVIDCRVKTRERRYLAPQATPILRGVRPLGLRRRSPSVALTIQR